MDAVWTRPEPHSNRKVKRRLEEYEVVKQRCGVCGAASIEYCLPCRAFRCPLCDASGIEAVDCPSPAAADRNLCGFCWKAVPELWCFGCENPLCSGCAFALHIAPDGERMFCHLNVCTCRDR